MRNVHNPRRLYIGQPKPEAKIFTGKDGKRFLGTGFEVCIKCKHVMPAEKMPEEKRREAEFALMMHRSGYNCVSERKDV